MITRSDFDACNFPELRSQLTAGADALFESVSTTWNQEQIEMRRRSLVPRDCPLCGSSRTDSDQIVTKHEVDVVRCRKCSMVYTSSVARSGTDLLTFTNSRSSEAFIAHHEGAAYRELARRKHEYYLQEAETFVSPGTLLDVGCCAGEFMEAARTRGWDPVGIDASEHFVSTARNKGFDVRLGVYPDTVGLERDEQYRMISLLDVLEHFHDPVDSMRSLKPHLDRGGVLLVQVPNFNSPLIALQGAASRNYALSHWSHFTRHTLAASARTAGFDVLKIQTVITELDLIRAFPRPAIEQSIRNVIGNDVAIPEAIEAEWLHEHWLGYKLFGLFA